MFPVLLRIPGLTDKVFPGQKTFLTMVDNLVTEHKNTWDPDRPPRDLTDAFLAEIEKVRDYGLRVHGAGENPVTPKCHHLESSGRYHGGCPLPALSLLPHSGPGQGEP